MKFTFTLIIIILTSIECYSQSEIKPYKKHFDSGELKTEGQYKNKKRTGEWKNYYKNGQVSRIYSYSKGKQSKIYTAYYKDGVLKYKTQKEGDGYLQRGYSENGKLYFERLLENGYYKEFLEDGTLKVEANYVNRQLDGIWEQYYQNGQVEWRVIYKDGYREGQYEHFYQDGQLKLEGEISKDKKNGKETRYTNGGLLEWDGYYKDGSFNKTWTRFNNKGKKIEKIKFKDAIAITTKNEIAIDPTKIPDGVLEKVPIYPGCEDVLGNNGRRQCMSQKISRFVSVKFNADLALSENVSGKQKIIVAFKIDKTGSVIGVKAKAFNNVLQEEAIRVIKLLPKLTPGVQRGKKVIVPYSLPITFQVK